MKERLCSVQYQTIRCRNAVTQYVRNKAKGEFSSVKYIITTLGRVALKIFHGDETLNMLFISYKGTFPPVLSTKAYRNGDTALPYLFLVLAINVSE